MQSRTMIRHRNLQGYPVVQLLSRKEVRIMDMQEDMVTMRNGRMLVIRKGEMALMEDEVMLTDGTRVTMDGTIVMNDGTTRTMMEGEAMTMDGRLTDIEDIDDEDMEDEDIEDDEDEMDEDMEDLETEDDI